jgi:TM2 domain-containing membrane protein YozV
MTDPQFGSTPGSQPGDGATPPQQPFNYPPPPPQAGFGYPPPMPEQYPEYPEPGMSHYPPPPPPPGVYYDPSAPYGRDVLTGEPLSDKSKVIAGLLQLIGLFGLLGFGRIYIGQTGLGVAQLVIGIVITVVTCGFGFIVPFVWAIVDAIIMFAGSARDSQGRPLRDGT